MGCYTEPGWGPVLGPEKEPPPSPALRLAIEELDTWHRHSDDPARCTAAGSGGQLPQHPPTDTLGQPRPALPDPDLFAQLSRQPCGLVKVPQENLPAFALTWLRGKERKPPPGPHPEARDGGRSAHRTKDTLTELCPLAQQVQVTLTTACAQTGSPALKS